MESPTVDVRLGDTKLFFHGFPVVEKEGDLCKFNSAWDQKIVNNWDFQNRTL